MFLSHFAKKLSEGMKRRLWVRRKRKGGEETETQENMGGWGKNFFTSITEKVEFPQDSFLMLHSHYPAVTTISKLRANFL